MESCYVLEQRKQVYETSLIVPSLIINNNDPLVCLLLFCEALCATMSSYENID
jgi:Na+/pantothenate symporter